MACRPRPGISIGNLRIGRVGRSRIRRLAATGDPEDSPSCHHAAMLCPRVWRCRETRRNLRVSLDSAGRSVVASTSDSDNGGEIHLEHTGCVRYRNGAIQTLASFHLFSNVADRKIVCDQTCLTTANTTFHSYLWASAAQVERLTRPPRQTGDMPSAHRRTVVTATSAANPERHRGGDARVGRCV